MAFAIDGVQLLSASDDKTVKMHKWRTGELERTFSGHRGLVSCVVAPRSGQTVVSSDWNGEIRIWNMRSGECQSAFTGHAGFVSGMAVPRGWCRVARTIRSRCGCSSKSAAAMEAQHANKRKWKRRVGRIDR